MASIIPLKTKNYSGLKPSIIFILLLSSKSVMILITWLAGSRRVDHHNPMAELRPYLFLHHAESNPCSELATCSALVR